MVLRLGGTLGIAEGPAIALAALFPFKVHFAIDKVQPIDPVIRCQQRKGRYAGFDPVCCEKLVLRSPLGIGNDHVLGAQLDVDGCELKMKRSDEHKSELKSK